MRLGVQEFRALQNRERQDPVNSGGVLHKMFGIDPT